MYSGRREHTYTHAHAHTHARTRAHTHTQRETHTRTHTGRTHDALQISVRRCATVRRFKPSSTAAVDAAAGSETPSEERSFICPLV